jgi:hypothetical protein
MSIHIVLLVIALVLLFLAAIGVPNSPRVELGWMGMFFWLLDLLVGKG